MARMEPEEPDIVSKALAKNRLGVPSVVFFGVAGAAPLTVIIGSITTIYAIIGSTAVPIAYLVTAGLLSLFTVGFVAMSRHIVNTGAFYSYISHGLGRIIGVGAAFVALPAYSLMQIGLFGLFGSVASGILAAFGFAVPWYACAIAAWFAVAILGLLWVDLSGKVLAVLLVLEIAVVLIYDLVMIGNPADGQITFSQFSPAPLATPVIGILMVLAIAGFVGFEATVVLSEEAKDPKRTIARATHIAVILAGVLCAVSAWAMSVNTGPDQIAARAAEHQTDLVFQLVGPHLPGFLIDLGYVLFLTSVFAALLAFHAAVSRYQFALGREGVLPAAWGRTHPRTGAPLLGSITQSVLAIIVLSIYALVGSDPLVFVFAWLTTIGGLGVLILMWAASAAVLAFFMRNKRGESAWKAYVAPATAFLLLTVVLAATCIGFGELLQVSGDSPFQWLIPALYLGVAMIGFVWALIMRAARPEVYAAIGRGTEGRVSVAPDSASMLRAMHADPVGARSGSGYPY
ncbi:amino acid/polyamine/organocation transporter (APC superfamily) [Paractinoplanes brasiliensis]|uniref:Amino acid/polyamine/organocation transporter (APC superfamily) n=2 Tax=Paractinoplanes brasiliensis TaxID=52695 RepID=A0A4R6JW63_9ACTN|nr:amino acid/polyamine/organocation transporter (APC superfamily) [Actinoplanes brasiliensis]GID26082.1 amino acid permease [Actinoplanes brasiliensis]